LRFGLVLLAVSYSICNLRQFKEARVVQDYSSGPTPVAARQQQQEQQRPRDWLEVSWGLCTQCIMACPAAAACLCKAVSAPVELLLLHFKPPAAWALTCSHSPYGRISSSVCAALPACCSCCALQVAGIAVIPTILAIAYGAMAGCLDLPLGSLPNVNVETWRADLLTLLQGAVLGWYACICGDAWSSELGELSGRCDAA
jgi:hypothetical protein